MKEGSNRSDACRSRQACHRFLFASGRVRRATSWFCILAFWSRMRQVSDMTVSVETLSSTLYSCGTVFPTNWPNCRDARAGLRAVRGEMEVLSPKSSQPRGGSLKQAGGPPAATKRSPRLWFNDGRRYPEIPTYCTAARRLPSNPTGRGQGGKPDRRSPAAGIA